MGIITFAAIAFVLIILVLMLKTRDNVVSNWHHGFDNFQFSTQEFYVEAKKAIEGRKIPGLTFSRTTHFGEGFFEAQREYLCVSRGKYTFEICAAPFGSGFFVSYWFIEKEDALHRFVIKVPILRSLASRKTYYQVDTENMFKSFVHTGVLEAVDQMTKTGGIRSLSEYERRLIETESN